MSVTTAIGTAVRGMNVTQDQIQNAANNIANVGTTGYITQTLSQGTLVVDGVGQGVEISSFNADVDEQLLISLQQTSSTLEKTKRVEDFYEKILRLYGTPNNNDGLNSRIDAFFTAMQNLSNNPQTASSRLGALTAANDLATEISGTVTQLQQLRFEADQEIGQSINSINTILSRLHATNATVGKFADGTEGRISVERDRSLALRELAEFMNISSITNSDGSLLVLGPQGTALLDSSRYELSYSGAASRDTFANDAILSALKVAPIDGATGLPVTGTEFELATSARSEQVVSVIGDGVLQGMINLRDSDIPKLIEQLDNLADAIRDTVNAIHNQGSSFPPPSTLTGTNSLANNTVLGFSGQVRIAVVNADGTPPTSPYTDETYYRPLTLDLSTLESGNGTGYPTVQTIMDEINEYYGPATSKASVGNIRDIKLAAISDSITDAGTVSFDLQLDSTSKIDSTVVVQAVTVIDPTDLSTSYTAATLPSPNSYTLNGGDRERTGGAFTVDFSGDDNRTSYTVRVRVQVTDADGTVSVADIDYTVEDDVTSIRNDRYDPIAVTNVSGTSNFQSAPSSANFAIASLVDANGLAVADGQPGFLQITTPSGSNLGLAIDELNSAETGAPSALSTAITGRGFSHYFGLNDLFTRNNETIRGSASNFAVRSDISTDSNKLSIGTLTLSEQPSDTTLASYTYELAAGNNINVNNIAALIDTPATFASTATLAATTTSFSSYATDITGYVAVQKSNSTGAREILEIEFQGLQQQFQDSAGVDTDAELALMIELENNFRAMSQIIQAARSMLEILTQVLGR